jgi:hypothetical protein
MEEPNPMAELVGPYYDASGAAARLGCPAEDLAERVTAGNLLCVVTADGVPLYPAFQFAPDGTVRPDLAKALRALTGHNAWSVAVWLRTLNDNLDGRSPDRWLAAGGDPEWVRVLAGRWAALLSA